MSERIALGDLVITVRPMRCCGSVKSLGRINCVDSYTKESSILCTTCGRTYHHDGTAVTFISGEAEESYRLKRIPPLEELERETRKEEIEA